MNKAVSKPLRILHVEDERLIAMEAKMELSNLGHEVSSQVDSGEKAVEEVERIHPDLVLMDIMLQGELDGIEAARRIRAKHDVAIIYCTAYTDKETRRRAESTKPDGYLSKPIDYSKLQGIMTKLFK